MLEYIRNSGWVADIPARDLTDKEVRQYGGEKRLLATGCYQKPKPEAAVEKAVEEPAKEQEWQE